MEGRLLDLAYDRGVPLVATNQPFFAKPEGHEAHDALLALAEGRVVSDPDRRRLTPEQRIELKEWHKTHGPMSQLPEHLRRRRNKLTPEHKLELAAWLNANAVPPSISDRGKLKPKPSGRQS